MNLKIFADEIVSSATEASRHLRKITLHFESLKLDRRFRGQPSIILMPADNSINEARERNRLF